MQTQIVSHKFIAGLQIGAVRGREEEEEKKVEEEGEEEEEGEDDEEEEEEEGLVEELDEKGSICRSSA